MPAMLKTLDPSHDDILLLNCDAAKKHTSYIYHARYVPIFYIIIK